MNFAIIIILVSGAYVQALQDEDTLRLVHVVFRHGDRTPDGRALHPTDPYLNYTYYPIGMGELTNEGKVTAYNIGHALRERYGSFLGDVYTPGVLEAQSSPVSRCLASLQLVLAALYPPSENLVWNQALLWQPIPYSYSPNSDDFIFLAMENCPNLMKYFAMYEQTPDAQADFEPYQEVLEFIGEHSGLTMDGFYSSWSVIQLYSTFNSQDDWGLELPEWTQAIWPEPLSTMTAIGWRHLATPKEAGIIGAGKLLSKILSDTVSRMNGDESKTQKIYLYSGHDINLVFLLGLLGVFETHNPPYGAYVTFEVHEINEKWIMKLFYQDYTNEQPKEIVIPNCGDVCEINRFISLYGEYLNYEEICGN